MDQEYKCGLMVLNTKENGALIKLMAKESSGMQMVMFMKDSGLMTRLMVMEFMFM